MMRRSSPLMGQLPGKSASGTTPGWKSPYRCTKASCCKALGGLSIEEAKRTEGREAAEPNQEPEVGTTGRHLAAHLEEAGAEKKATTTQRVQEATEAYNKAHGKVRELGLKKSGWETKLDNLRLQFAEAEAQLASDET